MQCRAVPSNSSNASTWLQIVDSKLESSNFLPVMLNEAKISRPRPRPRPGSWGRGRDRGQSFEVKAEAEANFWRRGQGRGQR